MAARRKVRIPVSEIKEADVSYISLVTKPANRIPFRILKSVLEDGMFRLKMFKSTAPAVPGVVAYVVDTKGDTKALDVLAAQGVDVSAPEELEDGVVMVKTSEKAFSEADLVGVALTEHVGVWVENMKKGFDPYASSLEFDEAMKTSSFLPSIDAAIGAFVNTVGKAMSESESPEQFAGLVEKISGEFAAMVSGLAAALPAGAFSSMKSLKSAPAEEAEPEATPTDTVTDAEPVAETKSEAAPAEAVEEPPVVEEPAADPLAEVKSQQAEIMDVVKSLSETVASLKEAVEGIGSTAQKSAEAVDAIAASLKEVQEAHASQAKVVAEAVDLAKSARDAVNSTVLSAPPSGDTPAPVRKSSGVWDGSPLDTLFR